MSKEAKALEDVLDSMATMPSGGTLTAAIIEALAERGYKIVFDDSVSA